MKPVFVLFSVAISTVALSMSVSAHETGAEHKHFFVNAQGEKQIDLSNGEVAPPSGQSQGFGSVRCRTTCFSQYSCTTTCY